MKALAGSFFGKKGTIIRRSIGGKTLQKDWVIGIDASTTACKAMVWDLEGGLVSQGVAAIGMSASSLVVVINALRLNRLKL